MILINLSAENERAAFARDAAQYFRDNPLTYTYAKGDPEAGKLLAVRWNGVTVMVLRIEEASTPVLYRSHDLIAGEIGEVHHERKQSFRSKDAPWFMIWNPEAGGNPTMKHETWESAIGEANRLAMKHPGRRFHICVPVATITEPVNVARKIGGGF
tara:strand:- start:4635 stop:5102 length:468 start_codon:yes stop_codon:yes gene_type:complete